VLYFLHHSLNTYTGLIYVFSFLQSVEGMKVICHELTQAADPESTVLEDLIKEADRLVSCLAVMVSISYVIQVLFSQVLFDHGSSRFQKPSILAYLGLLQGLANMS
jgi:hypothetical protein